MRRLILATAAAIAAMGSAPASADTICEWIDFSQTITAAATPAPGVAEPPRTVAKD